MRFFEYINYKKYHNFKIENGIKKKQPKSVAFLERKTRFELATFTLAR